MNTTCFQEHPAYLKTWPNGICICVLCNVKQDLVQASRAVVLREKLHQLTYNVCVEEEKKTKPNVRFNRVPCEKCGSFQVLYRIKANGYRCLLCGHLTPKKDQP